MNVAIAKHLNIAEESILRVEEWANCLFIVAKKLGARFVSKKVLKTVVTIEDVPKTIEEARDFGNIRFHDWNEEIRMIIVEIVNCGSQIDPNEHPRRDPLGIKAMSLVNGDGRSFNAIMKIASKLGAKIRNY